MGFPLAPNRQIMQVVALIRHFWVRGDLHTGLTPICVSGPPMSSLSDLAASAPFVQSVDFIVPSDCLSGLVGALAERIELHSRAYPGFLAGCLHFSGQAGHQVGEVQMQLKWNSTADAQLALQSPRANEPDLFQIALKHRTRSIVFRTYQLAAEVRFPATR